MVLIRVAAVVGMAAPAYADSNHDEFLAERRQVGLTYQDRIAR